MDASFIIKNIVVGIIAYVVYREIIKSVKSKPNDYVQQKKANFIHLLIIGTIVSAFTYAGMSMTWIETRDLHPYRPSAAPKYVSVFDPGVIEVNGMYIKTNLAKKGTLSNLAGKLVQGCNGDDGCEAQRLFDYVTALHYRTDHTSRNALDVVNSGWGDCDDKSNLFASLLNERNIDYLLIYVPKHVFMAVQLNETTNLGLINAHLHVNGKNYFYAETTSKGASIGEFNGQFPSSFEGIYDLKNDKEVSLSDVTFRLF